MSLSLKSLSATMEANQQATNAVLAAIMAKLGGESAAPPAPPAAAPQIASNPLAKYLPATQPAAAPPAPPKQHREADVVDIGSGKSKTRCISFPIVTKPATGNDYTDRVVMGYHKIKSILLQLEHAVKYCEYCEAHGEGGAQKV